MSSCSGGSYSQNATINTPPQSPNPNPYRFHIEEKLVMGNYTIMKVTYTDCSNFEGKKILVFDEKFKLCKKLDPHFSTHTNSPIARFKPDENGWAHAKLFTDLLNFKKDKK